MRLRRIQRVGACSDRKSRSTFSEHALGMDHATPAPRRREPPSARGAASACYRGTCAACRKSIDGDPVSDLSFLSLARTARRRAIFESFHALPFAWCRHLACNHHHHGQERRPHGDRRRWPGLDRPDHRQGKREKSAQARQGRGDRRLRRRHRRCLHAVRAARDRSSNNIRAS